MHIMSKRKIWFSLSLAIILVGLVFGLSRGLNIGIDFTGGTIMQVHMGKVVEVQAVEDSIAAFKLAPEIIHSGVEKKDIIIRTKTNLVNADRNKVFDALQKDFNLDEKALISVEQLGPAVGQEIEMKAIYGILASCICILAYITFRFEIIFGLATVVALLHDVFIVLAIYAIFYIPIDISFIAAVLTVLGYSVMDTVVIFDRIRENVRFLKKNNYDELADLSIMETLRRSLITSGITTIVIALLYVYGVESIKNFTFPLMVGIIAGTYSSICIASPIWSFIKKRQKTQLA